MATERNYILHFLKYEVKDPIVEWFNFIKKNQKCTSFIPRIKYDTAYWFNIFDLKNYIHEI